MRHLLCVRDLGAAGCRRILERARELSIATARPRLDFVVGLLFFQPSTRTRIGFSVAASRLGGTAVVLEGTKDQPGMFAPESISDTVRVMAGYADLLVMRHGDSDAVREAAAVSRVPLISAGAGKLYHPTQALIDLYAVQRHLGRLDSLRVGIAGDIKTSRTGHSFLRALAWHSPAEVRLMAPEGHGPNSGVLELLDPAVVTRRKDELDASGLDVLYMAGMPPGTGEERIPEEVCVRFRLTRQRIEAMPPRSIALCALPRTGDIDPDVDNDPRAVYFVQSDDGLYIRMAVLEYVCREAGSGV